MTTGPAGRRYVPTRLRTTASAVRSVAVLARDRNLTYTAAGIAYYAFVSIIPLMLLVVALASFFGGEALATRVTALVSQRLSASGQELVTQTLTGTTGRGAASVIGILALTWSGMRVFRGLDQAFDEVYIDESETSLLEQVRNAIVVIAGIGLAVLFVVGVGLTLSMLPPDVPFVNALGAILLVVGLVLAFLPMYYVLPPVDVSVREVVPGAVVAAIGWLLLQIGFRFYAANAGQYAAYGIIGTVLLFVTWLYFASMVVLLGAAVNAVGRVANVDPT